MKKTIERNNEDDILDALSLFINKKLKTEKNGDDKKNNVYFWLFKLIILIIYIGIIDVLFDSFTTLGVELIYYFSISLRSVLSVIFMTITSFAKYIFILYTLFKNLNIFMNSTYYKKLYSKDRNMTIKKNKLFKMIKYVLQIMSFIPLLALGFSASVMLLIVVLLVVLYVNGGAYSIGISLFVILSFFICFFLFKEIYNRFFEKNKKINRNIFIGLFISIIISILVFGYETNSYKISEKLPLSFDTTTRELYFDIDSINKIIITSNSKYNNIRLIEDNSLNNMKITLNYFETSKPFYKNILDKEDTLRLVFDSTFIPELDTPEDILKLGVDTIKYKTIYNYNMLKYPEISIYVNRNDINKVEMKKGF